MDQQTDDLIKKEIENNEICLFMKGTPDAPQCGFSMAVTNMLKILEVNFKGINVLENEVTENSSSEDIQTLLYEVGKKHEFENLKDFFKLVYKVMLGQDQGPRLGSFFKLFGLRETIDYLKKLIDN